MNPLQGQIRLFLEYLRSERNLSVHTVSAYRTDLDGFAAFVAEQRGSAADAAAIDHLLLRLYLACLGTGPQPYTKSSIGRKLAAVRAFFSWLTRTGRLTVNPAELVATPKKEQKLPFHLNIDQTLALVESVPLHSDDPA